MKLDQEASSGATNRGTRTVSETDAASDEGDGSDCAVRSIGKDDAFHVLQNARRRAVLRHLLDHPDRDEFRMRDVAESVAAWEHDTTVEHLSSDQRQRVYIALYQSHLPKLDDHGVIRYNQSRGIVEPTPLLSVFGRFLTAGLHADNGTLTVQNAGGHRPGRTDTSRSGLTGALSTFLTR